jgi:glycine cleavage system T protein
MGGYERQSEPAFMPDGTDGFDRIPPDFNGRLLEDDWDRFEEITENSKRRIPVMDEVKITKLINGPEAFTPDNEFCLGETEVGGLFVASGFCAHGLAGAGGIGKVMAEWIDEGEPTLDLWHMDIRRFGAQYRSPAYTHARIKETYESYYDIRYPNHERQAGRPLRVSPATAWHREHDAALGEKSGWERVNWYDSNAAAGDESLRPRGWAGQHWSPAIGAEHRATREGVAIFDESSFAKLEIAGPGAPALIERLCGNEVAREPGRITYTQMLNTRGGIECDFTVSVLDQERFSIVTGTAFGNHDREWIRRHLPDNGTVQVNDVTSQYACFGIWGPSAREVLQPLTPQDLGNQAFPYMSVREITVGNVPVRALRVTYVGELGWELYCPTEYGLGLWRTLWEAGEPHGIVAGGYRAIDSLRLEKGYLVWGADITPDETPYEAGLGFAVKLEKEGGFIGRDALAEAKRKGPGKRLATILLEDPRSVALGNEPVRIDGEICGRVTTGGYGYTVERSIAYAYVPPERAEPGTGVEIEIFGSWIPGEVAEGPLLDPKGERIRA